MNLSATATTNKRNFTSYNYLFNKIFNLNLKDFFDVLLGLDIVKLDSVLGVPDGVSTRDFILKNYGEDGVRMIEVMLGMD